MSYEGETADELTNDVWRLPAVDGEAEADALVCLKGVFAVCPQFLRNEKQPFLRGGSQLLCRPTSIPSTRKIEYHTQTYLIYSMHQAEPGPFADVGLHPHFDNAKVQIIEEQNKAFIKFISELFQMLNWNI